MMQNLEAVLRDAVECRCHPNIDDIDCQNILFAIDDLRAKVAELEAALRKVVKAFDVVEIDSEECLDFDECMAMLVPLDAYHGMSEAITTINKVLGEE